MMFCVPLMCCEYRDVLLLTWVHPSQRDTSSCDSVFTGSKDALCTQPSDLELSVNEKICDPCPSFSMVMYIDIVDARNYRRSSVSLPWHADEILHRHARPL